MSFGWDPLLSGKSDGGSCTIVEQPKLRDVLKRLWHEKVLFKLGYGGYAMGMIFGKPKNRHPDAHEAYMMELEDL